jgi:hypothetical protein
MKLRKVQIRHAAGVCLGGPVEGRRRTPGSVAKLDQVVKATQAAMGTGVVADLAAVEALVEKLGVDEVVEIAKLFG